MIKIIWIIRALFYKPFFGRFDMISYLGKPIIIFGIKKIYVGKNVRIFPHVRLEAHGENAKITISDDVAIAQNVHITSGANLIIGKASTILANVFITNIDHDYEEIGVHILKQNYVIKDTQIGDNCYIGIGACIQAGTILGNQCIVGANSVVRGKFSDYCVIAGVPAKIIKKYDLERKVWRRTNPDGSYKENI
ncbi:DapH/DapD/GlmU-related protein [Pedobacter cryotolerans]|uniref:Acyltransferase n=1 Tax=Pedobacter cryotolerans TaxID=2571270 RepID=A0A4U1CC11_9SPHI|nr:DapH/DapD/GlmU-related protein [Pedobacter cryotolerans]TKC03498.1 acyltransferase [Pedobacter cryotolerans]